MKIIIKYYLKKINLFQFLAIIRLSVVIVGRRAEDGATEAYIRASFRYSIRTTAVYPFLSHEIQVNKVQSHKVPCFKK